jgi:hypothetical protein
MGLSTSPSEISAAELNSIYNRPPSSSMVILGGCMSFSGAPESQSPLAQAVSEATVRGGYPEEVLKTWLQDSTAVFFQKMAEGMTAGQANDYVWDVYRPKWLVERGISEDNKNVVHLEFFGDEDFSL